ncbi:MAG: alpha-2-macroglobulin family protein, partial [Bacteroidota bacterium]|nr:alpha-2-macroglobulin family protein [Bacteroidota bacterium]
MRKSFLFIVLLTCISIGQLYSQERTNWKQAWEKVNAAEQKGLPQSALKIVDNIYQDALKAEADEQILKSVIYRIKLKNYYQENQIIEAIESLDVDNKEYSPELKAFTHILAAKLYAMYYNRNRYNIDQRTSTGAYQEDDIATWTKADFTKAIDAHFIKALEDKALLAKVSIKKFSELIDQNDYSFEIQPSLYDFFVHDIVDYYVTSNTGYYYYSMPEKPFLEKSNVFLPALLFVTTDYSMDTGNKAEKAMAVLKDLLKYRINDDLRIARVYTDLRRLQIAHEYYAGKNADDEYFKALSSLHIQFEDEPVVRNIDIELAKWYENTADDIQHIPGDTLKAHNYKKADSIADIIIENHGKCAAVKEAQLLKRRLRGKYLHFQSENTVIANQAFPVYIEYKNVKTPTYSVLKIDPEDFNELQRKHYGVERIEAFLKKGDIIRKNKLELPGNKDFVRHSTEFISEALEPGFYVLLLSVDELSELEENYIICKSVYVSNIAWFTTQKSKSSEINLYVTNSTSGKPVKNATVKIYKHIYDYHKGSYIKNLVKSTSTNDKGIAAFIPGKNYANYIYEIETDDEKIFTGEQYYYNYNQGNERWREKVHFFTDRSVYRPGQTIHVKGICMQSKVKEHKLLKNYSTTVTMMDANYQQVAQKHVTSNEFGSFNTEFVLPDGLLNGQIIIKSPHGSTYVRLEEYKRPSFEVKPDPADGDYLLGKEMTLSGVAESYTGAFVSDAEYTYRIFREPVFQNYDRWWYYSYLPRQRKMVSHGSGTTNDKGRFEVTFSPEAPPSYPKEPDISFRYTLEIDVTDVTGETHNATKSVVIGYRTLKMYTDIAENVDISSVDSLNISTMNLNNESIETQGSLIIYELEQPDRILNEKPWNVPEFHIASEEEWREKLPHEAYSDENQMQNYPEKRKVISMRFNTTENEKYKFPALDKITPGMYKIELHADDAFGIPVVEKQYVRIFDKSSRKTHVMTPLNLHTNAFTYRVGETMEIEVATAFKDAMVYLLIVHEDKIVHDDWINLDQSRKLLEYEITEKWRGGITINAMLVKNGELHQQTRNVTVPYYNKQLNVEYLHFRDETLPGSEEEIQMKISGWNEEAAAAEVLATMYDASLDALYVHNFNLQLYYPIYPSLFVMSESFQAGSAMNLLTNIASYQQIIDFETKEPVFNLMGLTYYGYYRQTTRTLAAAKSEDRNGAATGAVLKESEETAGSPPAGKGASGEKKMDDLSVDSRMVDREAVQSQSKNGKDKAVQIRKNFNETAFFYPDLRTDENGNVTFSFTSPESLTKWKFLALAHTKDLCTVVTENEMVTRKKLMVVPNMPRFFREGDEMKLNVKVSNLTDGKLNGIVELSFLNVLTGKDVTDDIIVSAETVDFSASANGNTSVGFDLVLPEGIEAVEYKLIAKTDKYGDGEQKIIPVLSNRMLVTESMPMYVNGNDTKTWHFEKLKNSASSSSLKHHKLTLEMTPRPAWYAIQALPYLMEYPYECSEQVFSRYYANSMASWIANSDPQIQRIFEAWKNLPESNALTSNLEKNQDLKANMLEQTPWVLQAKDESERKRRVGVLFDMERMSREQTSAFAKLKKKQVSSGGWPWFEGMPVSRYITQHIVSGLSHLRHLDVLDDNQLGKVDPMIKSAIGYLDREIKSDYDYLKANFTKKEMEEKHISYIHVHYLYARSFSHNKVQIPPRYAEAYTYYYNQAKTYWVEMNYYSKAMIALTMYRTGEQDVANDIMKSLKEYAIVEDEMGMYWKNPPGYYWYQAPIETQAMLIEAFDEITDDDTSVERMKQWLLNQKRTQDWKTTKATAEAIYALILTGENLLDLDAGVLVEIGGKVYDPKADDAVDQEAGTGYFRKDWTGSDVKPEMGDVKLTKTGEGMAWGALHWQYFEDMDKITSHETPLQLEKKLFIRVNTDEGTELQLIDDEHTPEIGDRMVVRIILRSDRDMEYVHMKDMRAS